MNGGQWSPVCNYCPLIKVNVIVLPNSYKYNNNLLKLYISIIT